MTGNVSNPNKSGVGGICGKNDNQISDVTFYGNVSVDHSQDNIWVGDLEYNGHSSLTKQHPNPDNEFEDDEALNNYLATIPVEHALYRQAVKYPYAINATTNGLGTITVNSGGEDNVPGARPNKLVTVTAVPGTIIKDFYVRDADDNNVPISNLTTSGFTFTMPRRSVEIRVYFDVPNWPTQGAGTEDDPYLITSEADWNGFAYNVVYGNSFSGKYVKLNENINVTTMVGRDANSSFEGIFDGGGHTLTFTKGTSEKPNNEEYCGPFRYVKDGTVKNLHVSGTIYTSAKYAGGLVGHSLGDVTITNCISSVTINSSVSGEGRHGGLVGVLESFENRVTISGCVFDGTFATTGGTTDCSGFIGYTWSSVPTICNSVMKPASVAADMLGKTFADWYLSFEPTVINCNYVSTDNLPTNQGKQSHTITAGDAYTTIEAVTPVGTKYATYGLTGINAYLSYYNSSLTDFVNGLACGSTAYCGDGDKVNLTLSNTAPSPGENLQNTYTSSAGTLSGNTLLMPDADVTISVDIDHPVPLDWAIVSEGTQEDPYKIYTAEQLNLLAERVNNGTGYYPGKYFKLMNDIEYSHTTAWDDATSTENNFTPIGYGIQCSFSGDFDGNGHTISGIRIHKATNENVGLFGFTDWSHSTYAANIHDLTLADARISGGKAIGGIVGCNNGDKRGGTVTRCHVAANVAIHAVFYVEGYSRGFGGIVGYNSDNTTVSHCTSAATITADDGCKYIGAIAGNNFYGTLSDNLAIGATIPAAADNSHGAICGKNNNGSIQRSYYINCTVAGVPNATNVGCYGADITANNGAVPAYSITAGEYVTMENTGTIGVVYDDVIYAGSGDEVSLTLGSNHPTFSATGYQASAGTLTGSENPYTLTMPGSNVTINATSWTSGLSGIGTAGNPFLISTTTDWDIFANYVNNGYTFSGEFLKLTADITDISTMAGTSDSNSFQGTFDGDGHKLTFTKGLSEEPFNETGNPYCAPFRHVKNATIKNLHVDGTIYTNVQKAAGFVGESHGALTITNSRSSINIHSSKSGDGTHGGFVATLSGANNTITISGCVFDGSFATTNGTTNCGGFVGWPVYNRPTITNSLMMPSSVDAGMLNNTFARWHIKDNVSYEPTITNCYYVSTANLPANQGAKVAVSTTEPTNLGNLVQDYGMMKAHANGILFNSKYYVVPATISLANADDNRTTISNADGYLADVTLSGRTLYKDGAWNTICLPFNVTLAGSPLAGAIARALTEASISGTTLYLTFGDAVDELQAGTPYIIKWTADANYEDDDAHNIVNPVFTSVFIDKTDRSYDNGVSGNLRVRFSGTYKSTTFESEDKSILFLGTENTLYYPQPDLTDSQNPKYPTIGTQRAYFKIGDGNALARQLTVFNIDFGGGEVSGIKDINHNSFSPTDSWYSLDGCKLSGKPTASGVYVNNGRKFVIK